MILFRPNYLAAAISLSLISSPGVQAQTDTPEMMEETYVYGEQGTTDTATRLDLTVFETPQTITSVSRVQLDDFALHTINKTLDYIPGVTVEEVETDRTYYTARGFDIVNFQYDGVGIPFISGLNLGQQDTAIYEKVEVVKGAAGLSTGLANPSATVNYVRKRPTEDLRGSVGLTLGEWQTRRVDTDVSGALGSSVRGRLVIAYDDGESYLDRHEDETQLAYGIVEFDVTDSTLVTVGHSYDNSHSTGVLWGALPLLYSDGSQTDYDVSTNTSPDWTFADAEQNQTFIELKQQLGEHWSFNAVFTHNTYDYESELFYVYGTPDPVTELGLTGLGSAYSREEVQDNADVYFQGNFPLGGRLHQLVAGYSYSETELTEASYSDPVNFSTRVLGSDWAQGNTPPMSFTSHDPASQESDINLTQKAWYFATRLNVLDDVSLLLGARDTRIEQSGTSYGAESNADDQRTVPFVGATYQLVDDLMLYTSYSEVYKQQTFVNDQLTPIGSTLGESTEVGIKKSFNNERAVLTLAWFSSEQDDYAEFVGRNGMGIAIYRPVDYESEGYEIEFSGELVDGLNIGAGYTRVDVESTDGLFDRPYIPEDLLKLSATYRLRSVPDLKIGGVVKWQDATAIDGELVKQDSYTLVDLAVQYQLIENVSLALNVENVTDEKYFQSLYWTQAYYGAPRNVSASLRWTY